MLIAAALALVEAGPGALSLDAARGRERSGTGWTLAALVTGALGAFGARAASSAAPQAATEPAAMEPEPAETTQEPA